MFPVLHPVLSVPVGCSILLPLRWIDDRIAFFVKEYFHGHVENSKLGIDAESLRDCPIGCGLCPTDPAEFLRLDVKELDDLP